MNYKYQGLIHYPIRIIKERPKFYIELFHKQWKYLAKHPRKINYQLFQYLFFRRKINMQEFYKIIFSKNYNLACEYAIKNQYKKDEPYCNHCPYRLNQGYITSQCKIPEFNRYNELMEQYLFNLTEYIKYSKFYPAYVPKAYKFELKRIHNQIKDLIYNNIFKLEIRPGVIVEYSDPI